MIPHLQNITEFESPSDASTILANKLNVDNQILDKSSSIKEIIQSDISSKMANSLNILIHESRKSLHSQQLSKI